MKYRSRLDIIAMMLEAVGDGSKKTKIMYEAYLSYRQMGEYLAFLLEKELIVHDSAREMYRLTDKGRTALSFITDLERPVGVVGRQKVEFKTDQELRVRPELRQ